MIVMALTVLSIVIVGLYLSDGRGKARKERDRKAMVARIAATRMDMGGGRLRKNSTHWRMESDEGRQDRR